MKRILFYLLLVGAIVGGSAVVLWVPGFMPYKMGKGQDLLEVWIKSMTSGAFSWQPIIITVFRFGMALFVLMNAAILLTMLLVFLFSGFSLNKIAKFYRICIWYFVSALVMTGVYVAFVIDLKIPFKDIPWIAYIPAILGVVVIVVGIILRKTEKNK